MPFRERRGKESGEPTAQNITFLDAGDNPFAESVEAGHRVDPRAQKIFVLCVVLVALYVFALIVPKDLLNEALHNTSSAGYAFSWFVADLQENISSLIAVLTGSEGGAVGYSSYMIRYVVIALAGAGLALSGAIYQGAFRNALVSPSTLGVMTGGQFGLMLWVVLFSSGSTAIATFYGGAEDSSWGEGISGVPSYLSSSLGAAIISFAGCLIVVGLVLLTMRLAGGGTSAIMMIITGQVISGVLGAIYNAVRYYYVVTDPYGEIAQMLTELQIASFWRSFGIVDIIAIGTPLLITFLVVMYLRQKMMVLAFDDAERRTIGIDARRMQFAVVMLCTLLTAIIVSFCGTVGFVGFLVPHLTRRLVGPNFKYLLPASTVLGAIFVLGAYVLLLMTLGTDYETMVGMYISIAGATVFLVTALRGKGAMLGGFR